MTKIKKQLPPLAAVVKRIRQASGMSQEHFARSVDLAVMTVSRFENGRQVPSDFQVLTSLHNMAAKLGLEQERDLLADALSGHRYRNKLAVPMEKSPVLWRLMQAVRIALLIDPERARAIKEAVGEEALGLVDEVLRGADPTLMFTDPDFWAEKETELTSRANQRAFEQITEGKR